MKTKTYLIILIILCLTQNGCAGIGQGIGGLMSGATSVAKLPFEILGKALDIASRVPKPPPWVFF